MRYVTYNDLYNIYRGRGLRINFVPTNQYIKKNEFKINEFIFHELTPLGKVSFTEFLIGFTGFPKQIFLTYGIQKILGLNEAKFRMKFYWR